VSAVTIRYFTDPACPPDPARMRLRWLYGDRIGWELRMIVLRERRGHGWPQARGSDATVHACRAVVGTRLRWPGSQEAMLRHLQVLAAAGEPLDDSDTLEIAAERAGLPVTELAAYCAAPEVEAALRADTEAAAGRRCGMQELVPERRGDTVSVEATLDRTGKLGSCDDTVSVEATQDLAGDLGSPERRDDPVSVVQVIAWAGIPLAASEVAAVCGRDVEAELGRVARFADGYWWP
jgi:hypothetical protein